MESFVILMTTFLTKGKKKEKMRTLQVTSNFNRVATATTETQFKYKGENQQVRIQIPTDRSILNNLFNILIRESFRQLQQQTL